MAKKEDPFARVSKAMLQNPKLSWRSKGILAYLLGKPAGWKLRAADIRKHGKEGERAIWTALREMRACGYSQLSAIRNGNRISEWIWKVSDTPIFLLGRNAHLQNEDIQNAHHSKNEFTKKEIKKKEGKGAASLHRDFFPAFPYPKSEDELYQTLEAHGIDAFPDHDGDFFDSMTRNGWKIRGKPVFDWIETYRTRTEKIQDDM